MLTIVGTHTKRGSAQVRAGLFTCLLNRTGEAMPMRFDNERVILTARYLFGPMANAIPAVQLEYYALVVHSGVVIQ